LGTSTVVMPAARAARNPFSESSITSVAAGSAPSRRAASRKTSGSGLPWATSSDDTTARNTSVSPVAASAASITRRCDDEARAVGQRPAIRRTASTAPSIVGGPSRR
jgi:hypothetical protein